MYSSYEEYFTGETDQGLLDYVKRADGYLSATLAEPSGMLVCMVDARLVPPNRFGYKIIVKCINEQNEISYAFFVERDNQDYVEFEKIAAKYSH